MKAKQDCYEYVRGYYKVNAHVGGKVSDDKGREGVIVAAKSDLHYVHVRLEGQNFAVNFHPMDLEYLGTDGKRVRGCE